jgi:hypothetical protein
MNSKVKLFAHPGCAGGLSTRKYFQCHEIPYKESPWSELVQVETELPKNLVIVSPVIQVFLLKTCRKLTGWRQ